MKKRLLAILLIISLNMFLFGCSDTNVNIEVTEKAADGLDLEALGDLVKKANNAEELEKLLNQKEGVNNLDLDEDDKTDYISVQDFSDPKNPNERGYSLTIDQGDGDVQEIATITFNKSNDNEGDVYVTGNEQIYGDNHCYHSHMSFSEAMFLAWLFSPRYVMYASPYHFGYYPPYYLPYAPVPMAAYRSRVTTTRTTSYTKTSSGPRTSLRSPNAGRTSNKIKAPLSKPTASQKSFQASNPSKNTPKAGGFSNKSGGSSGASRSGGGKSSTPSRPSPSRSSGGGRRR